MLTQALQTLDRVDGIELTGTVSEVQGLTLRVADLPLPVGAMVRIGESNNTSHDNLGEVVGFDDEQTIVMLLGQTAGIRRGQPVVGLQSTATAPVSNDMLGRVVNALGEPIDADDPVRDTQARPIHPDPIHPLQRVPIDTPLGSGVRAIDTMLTVGRGQRLGIFSGPGVGKSTLLGQIAQHTDADVAVIALVGERGREVNDFLQNALGEAGLQRSVVIVATGDESALMRVRAGFYALTVAEHFRDQGLDVVFFMDSVTRFCHAQRQIGLAVGEPPATKGYTPSVFAMLPSLMERCGRTQQGSITGFYTILVEGDDLTEPVSDACRGILDGHIVLSRKLANRAHYPAIDVTQSVSRVARDVTDQVHQTARDEVVRLLSRYDELEDLINIGAVARGANPLNDLAHDMKEPIDAMLRQSPDEQVSFGQSRQALLRLGTQIAETIDQLTKGKPNAAPAGPGGARPAG